MAIQQWSDDIVVADLNEDPQFSDELNSLVDSLSGDPKHVVLNFATVGFINSSNIAKLLRLRKVAMSQHRRMILCSVCTQVWSVLLVTGLEKVFECTNDVATALATVQLAGKA
jgi:anti-anti-sigma factor